jgi:hypothetical protein
LPAAARTRKKPTSHPDAGVHNLDMEMARGRIVEGGSWKKQDIVVLLPAADMVPLRCVMAWMNLIYPPNNGVFRQAIVGEEVGKAYSDALEGVLAHPQLSKFPYILTIEHDNAPPPDGVLKLCKHMDAHPEFSAISGLYWTKGLTGVPQIWGDIKDPLVNYRPQPPDINGGLVECYGTGMGFVLWRTEMFKDPRLSRPFFKTVCSKEEGVGTQDLFFWNQARQHGYRCAVACDVLVGHWDQGQKTMW